MTHPGANARDTLEVPPPAAQDVFGERFAVARAYAELLATVGVEHGVIGPREAARIWSRHLLNSAAVADAIPPGAATVVDVGSGAGLPGIPLALARPDLRVTLLEPLERRIRFLSAACAALELEVEVLHGRAETVLPRPWDVGVARAVAPLERLLPLVAPLLAPGGVLVAVKGSAAEEEARMSTDLVRRYSSTPATVRTVGRGPASATVLTVVIDSSPEHAARRRAR